MNEAKFTKGEWRVERFVDDKGFDVTFSDDGEVIADYVYDEFDAHLIAAAPEMYDYLLHMIEHDVINDSSIEREVKSLLAKARGEK